MFTDTALSLVNWLRVQEIWAQMYINKVSRQFEKVRHESELSELSESTHTLVIRGTTMNNQTCQVTSSTK